MNFGAFLGSAGGGGGICSVLVRSWKQVQPFFVSLLAGFEWHSEKWVEVHLTIFVPLYRV